MTLSVLTVLSRAGVPKGVVGKLVASHGGASKASMIVKKDVFDALREAGASLDVADRVAVALKYPLARRVYGHATWALASRQLSLSLLVARLRFSMELPEPTIRTTVQKLVDAGDLVSVDANVVTRAMYDRAADVAERINRRLDAAADHPGLRDAAARLTDLTDDQLAAVRMVAGSRFSVITGGPGTGKSHVVRQLIDVFPSARVTAPTGRAARNASGKTVHYFKTIQETGKNELSNVDLLIVDEASMISTDLMLAVLQMASPAAHIVLVGDVDQLPPIDTGDVLRDVIACGRVPTTYLRTNHRSVAPIQAFARAILDGRVDIPGDPAIDFLACDTFDDVLNAIPHLPEDAMILTPHNASRISLNRAAQLWRLAAKERCDVTLRTPFPDAPAGTSGSCSRHGSHAVQVFAGGNKFTASLAAAEKMVAVPRGFAAIAAEAGTTLVCGDRVIITKNTPDACNGDLGVFVINDVVDLDAGEQVSVPRLAPDDPGMTLAYAITVHKAQGSEFGTVVVPVTNTSAWDRTLLYTAVTRAKTAVVFLGTKEDLDAIVKYTRPPRGSVLRAVL